MKVNRPVNECHCWKCKHCQECEDNGVFRDNPDIVFCINYEDETYSDDDDNETD